MPHGQIASPTTVPPLEALGGSLLEWVDLDHPGLARARTLQEEGRTEEALRAVLKYFRTSVRPRLSEEPLVRSPYIDTTIADQALLGEITIGSATAVFKNWNQTKGRNVAWNWEMQRHRWWLDIAQAYYHTGDERYASFLNDLIVSWYFSNPCPASDATSLTRPAPTAWRTIDVGVRLGETWPEVFVYLRNSPSLTDEALAAFLCSCYDQAEYLVKYPKESRWLLIESLGLLTTAILYPEFRRAGEWLETANARLEGLARDEILPDGSHAAGSLGYLFPSLERFARAVYLERINGIDPPGIIQAALLQGLTYGIGIVEPSLYLPAVNDSDRLFLPDALDRFGPSLPRTPEIDYIRSERLQGYAPPVTSTYFPVAGHFVFRESWEPEALYAFFDVGVFGNARAHEDRLQFEVAAFGETLLGDMGRSTHEPGPASDFFMGTLSHNCILIDGHGMNFRFLPPSNWLNRSPLQWPHELESQIQWAQATYEGPWRDPALKVRWTRRFTFVVPSLLPGCWVISDFIEGEGKHCIDQLLNFYPGHASINTDLGRVYYQRNAAQLVVQALADEPVDIAMVQGQERPFLGWFSPYLGSIEPSPLAWVTGQHLLPVRRDLVLIPYPIGESCPLLTAGREDDKIICETVAGTLEIPAPFVDNRDELSVSYSEKKGAQR